MENSEEKREALLSVRNLAVSFVQYDKGLRRRILKPIRSLSLEVAAGELVAVVGASGSGKSLLAHAILGILPYNANAAGEIDYLGSPLTAERVAGLRGREIVLVPQSVTFLDPLMKVSPQIRKGDNSPAAQQRCRATLARYGLDENVEELYPFELSGGMARRVLIATAVMEEPRLVIADEPTPGLHVDVARRVLGHFREMAEDGAGVLLITHDLQLALTVAHRVVVFYEGANIEEATPEQFAEGAGLKHPYTQALLAAMPERGLCAPAAAMPERGFCAPATDMPERGFCALANIHSNADPEDHNKKETAHEAQC